MKTSFVASLIPALAVAQSLSGLPICAQDCALVAIGGSGCQVTDAQCFCMSSTVISSYSFCVPSSCSASDEVTAQELFVQSCASAGVVIGTAAATGSSSAPIVLTLPSPIPTTLITTTDSAGDVFTVTGEVLISGNSSTTVPCCTVITTNAAGVTVTRTETGSSVLPTELQVQRSGSQASTASAAASSSSTASPSISTSTGGAERSTWSNVVLVSVGLSGVSTIILALSTW